MDFSKLNRDRALLFPFWVGQGLLWGLLPLLIYPVRSEAQPLLPSRPGQETLFTPILTPGSTPVGTPTNTPTIKDEGYTLGAGDRVRLDIFNVPEYSGEHQVLSDGTLNLPLVGTVPVQGMTLNQVSQSLSTQFVRFIKRPIVTVSLLTARPLKVAIAGEVNRPGSYTVTPETGTTLTNALQLAGGIRQSADIRKIQVRRPRPQNQGAEQILHLDLWQLLQNGDLSQDIRLRDGDTILIPTATDPNLAEASQLAAASFSSTEQRPMRIAVVGEVNRPGPYTITGENNTVADTGTTAGRSSFAVPTVTQAIQAAGGITPSADIRRIQVRRLIRQGTEQEIQVNLWALLQAGDLRQDLPLQEGDTLVIPTVTAALASSEATELATASFSPDRISVNVVGEVARAGTVQVPPNTPLNQALLAAGGFNNRAQTGSVELIRLNANGSVSRRSLGVDFAQGLNENSNPALRNNDTIIVSKSGLAGVSDVLGTILSPLSGMFGLFRLLGF